MIWDKVKAAALWVWNWVTVLVAMVMGALTQVVQYLDQITGLDLTQFFTKERAAEVIFWTAVTKAVVAFYNSLKAQF
jgi:hypothetical protein